MTTLANNPMTLHAIGQANGQTTGQATGHDGPSLIGQRYVVSWPCTRRAAALAKGRLLERVMCVVAIQPLDQQHATIECWLESAGARQRTVLHSTTRVCAITSTPTLVHLDMAAADGTRLLTITIDRSRQRIVYAQSTLLRDAGLLGGTYDPPVLRAMTEERIAQSA